MSIFIQTGVRDIALMIILLGSGAAMAADSAPSPSAVEQSGGSASAALLRGRMTPFDTSRSVENKWARMPQAAAPVATQPTYVDARATRGGVRPPEPLILDAQASLSIPN